MAARDPARLQQREQEEERRQEESRTQEQPGRGRLRDPMTRGRGAIARGRIGSGRRTRSMKLPMIRVSSSMIEAGSLRVCSGGRLARPQARTAEPGRRAARPGFERGMAAGARVVHDEDEIGIHGRILRIEEESAVWTSTECYRSRAPATTCTRKETENVVPDPPPSAPRVRSA